MTTNYLQVGDAGSRLWELGWRFSALLEIKDPLNFIFRFSLLQKESGLKVAQFREAFLAYEMRSHFKIEGFTECPNCGFQEIYAHRHLKMQKASGYAFCHCARCDLKLGHLRRHAEHGSVFVAGGAK